MAPFRCEDVVSGAVPIHAGLAESGAGGDYGLIAYWRALHLVQRNHVLGIKSGNAPCIGHEIVDEFGLLEVELIGETFGVDDPGKVGSLNAPVANRSGYSKASGIGMQI